MCSERAYPAERFHGRVAHFPFDDHNPPPLGMFLYFCKDVEVRKNRRNARKDVVFICVLQPLAHVIV